MSNLYILPDEEQQAYDYPPTLPVDTRAISFAINHDLEIEISRLRTATNKVGFLLQYAYFKVCKRFFIFNRFRQEDVEYTAKLLGIAIHEVDLTIYKKRIPTVHQKKILTLLNYKPFDNKAYAFLEEEAITQIKQQIAPKQIFHHLMDLLQQNKIEIPAYHRLAELITIAYNAFEKSLLLQVNKYLPLDDQIFLDALLDSSKPPTMLSQLKTINQSTKPKVIQASLALFATVKNYFLKLNPAINALNLTSNSSTYYASWVHKSKHSQLTQFPEKEKLYLHLLAFIQHQFYMRQDYFVDIILKCVQSVKTTTLKKLTELENLSPSERRQAVRHVTQSNRYYRNLITEIDGLVKSPLLTDAGKVTNIKELLEEYAKQQNEAENHKIALFEKTLDGLEKNKNYFDVLENLSIKLQRRIAGVINALVFNNDSDKNLLSAIDHVRETDGQIKPSAPLDFLNEDEKSVIFDENQRIRTSLYKILLFIHIADAIKSGKLNLTYSYRYKSIYEYLIETDLWYKNREQLLKSANLETFVDCNNVLDCLKQCLDEKYKIVNHRFLEGRNPYLSFNKDGDIHIATPALEDRGTEYIAALLEQSGYVPALQILLDIEKATNFTQCFKHHSIKHVKQKPSVETLFAGIIGLGCNIGIRKMAQISVGIRENTLLNTVNWYFNLNNLQAANSRIIELINQLALSSVFIDDKLNLHSSSDGQKINVGVESLIANYSFKYYGKDKGVSMYTFIDERQTLFHSLVLSSAEREAAYVIDGLMQNNVVKTSIHSTDTHGFTETIFAATHLLDVAFAPRIKNIGKQRIYAFSTPDTYEKRGYKILPSRIINQKLIVEHWDDILRFMATIKLKKVTASQLFKRLSSYAKENPLYKALKEFGRIVKSIFILTYFDDVRLRQRIEKQLNRVELSNKFSNAIFFANGGEFNVATRDEQEIATACKVLVQNAIVLWNYLYLSQLLANCMDENERNEMISMIKNGSIITWRHINLHGEYDFSRRAANDDTFEMDKILSLKVA